MGLISTLRRALRCVAQRLRRRPPHEARGSLITLGSAKLTDTMLQLDPQSLVGEDKSAFPNMRWPLSARTRLESPCSITVDSGNALVEGQLPSGNFINRLPTELLSLVFLASAYEPNGRPHLDLHFVPLILTHVCARWRAIAVNMPPLWHRFDLRPCLEKGCARELADTCAERAKAIGLDISYHELSFNESDGSWYDGTTRLPPEVEFCDCLMYFIIEYID
ncbi:uncharacterized protein SCHCODRAFT_01336280 [Schizophyllum commune H4-8]|nr:uncharacterized protein SCHCODRAFT_01336280 [Schizophyllum commune H4-8]KAI5894196.1 hypothetical protein SCHCODRAFT_01336280 [Schizophyllum commune H4-8]